MVRYGYPLVLAAIVFLGADKILESFFSNIITIDGIFMGFTILVFSFEPIDSDGKNVKEVVAKIFVGRIVSIASWVWLLAPFVISMTFALSALLHTGLLVWIWGFVSFLAMSYGIMNLIVIIAERYFMMTLKE